SDRRNNATERSTTMKRLIFLTLALALAIAGAVFAQSPNTSAPGQTTNPQPNTANNDLANPGNPQDQANSAGTMGTTGSTAATTGSTSTPTAETTTTSSTASSLPKTASDLPLVGVIGLLAMASYFGLRAARRNA